jgi:hypothetical protein
VTLALGDALERACPDLRGASLIAHTARDGEWVVATSVCEVSPAP